MTTIAFIGLGHMGKPMALNLLKHGYSLTVFDIAPKAVQALVDAGATSAADSSIAATVKNADVIITMVQTGAQVSSICLGEQGLFAHCKPGALYIDSSSIDVATSRQLHQHAQEMGLAMVDAPVSGGVKGAADATLTIMVGGSEANFSRALPILQGLGKKIVHAGNPGSGQAAKICNNMLLGISMIGVCETFNLAKKLGLDAKKLYEISSNASGQCWSLSTYPPVPGLVETAPANHDYQPGFAAQMMLKDLLLSQNAAQTAGVATPLGAEATALYQLFVDQGFGDKDFSGIIQMLARDES
jgi:3-hydroxyisobutyrate dehydrogenase